MSRRGYSRRAFMARGAGAAGAIVAAKTVLLQGAPLEASPFAAAPAGDRVRFGIVGVGMQGSGLLDNAIQLPNAQCVAACDLYDGRHTLAKEIAGASLRTTRRYQDLLDALAKEYRENELFPPSDITEDWLKLTDYEPGNVVRLASYRPAERGQVSVAV